MEIVSKNIIFIYGLVDPRTNGIRYIGKTKQKLSARLLGHISESRSRNKTFHRYSWIRFLLKNDLKPSIILLEEVPADDWQWYETWWIKYERIIGWDLVNGTDGGEGLNNPSEETREKMRLAKLGKMASLETRQKQSDAHKGEKAYQWGKSPSDESRQKMSNSHKGKKLTEEQKRKISESNKHPSDKTRARKRELFLKNKLRAKLKEPDVIEIRIRYSKGEYQNKLAEEFGVSQSTISSIVCNKTWIN